MAQINFTVPDAKLAELIEAIKYKFPVPTDNDGNPLFTDNQWAKEAVRRSLVRIYHQYKQVQASQAVAEDDTIAS